MMTQVFCRYNLTASTPPSYSLATAGDCCSQVGSPFSVSAFGLAPAASSARAMPMFADMSGDRSMNTFFRSITLSKQLSPMPSLHCPRVSSMSAASSSFVSFRLLSNADTTRNFFFAASNTSRTCPPFSSNSATGPW